MTKLLLFFTVLIILPSKGIAKEKQVKLFLKWRHQFQFAGYYAAMEKGFFAEEGLDVEIIERDPTWAPKDKVGNEVGHYGVSDTSIIIDYLKGDPYLIVATIFQHSPLVIATRAEDKIYSPLELKGKKFMHQKDIDDAVFKVMFNNVGLKDDDVIDIPHSFSNDDLINGKVDAISIYSTNQPYYFKEKKQEIHIINPINYGVDLYGDLLFTNFAEAERYPERVEAMKRAIVRGWYYALENQEEIVKLIKDKYKSKSALGKLLYEARKTQEFIREDLIPIGTTNIARLERIARIYGFLDRERIEKLEGIIFNEFLLESKKRQSEHLKFFFMICAGLGALTLLVGAVNRKLKKEVLKKTSELMEVNKQKSLFFAKMTHELRTPLNAIIGTIFFLKETDLSDKQRELIEISESSSENLLAIVNEILEFSKMESQDITLNLESVNLYDTIKAATRFHAIRAEEKGIEFQFINIESKDLHVMLDPLRFNQIMNNLIGNALKFTDKGAIKVKCEISKNELSYDLRIDIEDSGRGIEEENLKKIFDPFKQEDESITNQFGGTGLGLAIAREIAFLFEGDLDVKSELGKGTTFTVTLVLEGSENPIEKIKSREVQADFSGMRALIVDDNEVNVLIMKKYLEKLGISTEFASNGKEAVEKVEQDNFDILFMDKLMPVMDGVTATQKIREREESTSKKVFIVGQSANWLDGNDKECIEIGMDGSLTKPTKFDSVVEILTKLIPDRPAK